MFNQIVQPISIASALRLSYVIASVAAVFVTPSPSCLLRRLVMPSPSLWPSVTCGCGLVASIESRYNWNFLLHRGDSDIAIEGCCLFDLSQ
ncbi:hypothetical protein DEO72_LG5g1058 [Vigna unguiculata]|uniref:Uncharacterized protein n=1 Tax=Vigna unguiculata TaxID=3917 RepID=A0A4D6LXB1_VIGUN|nr:hypothetical protein DEO72_LG5g1058 [Vigna unguiculata]